jgi:hypothetical protein
MTHTHGQDGQQTGTGASNQVEAKKLEPSTKSTGAGAPETTDQVYGLKFILEDGETKLFTSLPISLGRAGNNDVVLTKETVSAHHAQIYYDEKAKDICIIDLDSLNGVFIGDQPTRRNVLSDGAKIGLGTATLVFRDTGFIFSG